ncbi:MAG: hypothetical protein K0R54_78 [Clostridiaceae bacterium]|jgi:hypothetical protein|nr:hypothetical protein [Clostridiaceae bacterium]
MVGAIIALIIFLGILGGMSFLMYKTMKKTDPNNQDTSAIDTITTAQEFLPFEDIKDGMIILGGHKYRAIIECSSTNYNLKTDKEKEIIEISFQRFLNSLTFPITFFIQTKVIDNSKMLTSLREELIESIKDYPQLEEYANIYLNEMHNLDSYVGNNKQKKKYIIVNFDEAINLGNLSDEEKYKYSSKEIYTRASILSDGLSSVGVKTKILNTKELAELVYSVYHKDNYSQFENVVSGEFLSLITESENKIINLSDDAKIDWILYEAQMRIQKELLNENLPSFIKNNCEKSLSTLDKLRDEVGAYYKEITPEEIVTEDIEHEKEIRKNGLLKAKKGGSK